jgi:lysophospholipase
MAFKYILPDLEERFLPPENWQSAYFLNPETSHQIHYNFYQTKDDNKKGTLICLPGLSEFGEKYIETAKFFNTHGFDFFVIDWAYQGRSVRYKNRPHKRHSDGYDTDISDLHYFIQKIIKTDDNLYMLAHSMGGNIGLRYIIQHPESIKSACISTPMLGIKNIRYFSPFLKLFLSFFKKIEGRYVPGGKDWHENARSCDGEDIFSSDIVRDTIHNKWCLSNPPLQVGNPTMKWLYESMLSIDILKSKKVLQQIQTPITLITAEKEALVDNAAIRRADHIMPHAKLVFLSNAKHEILMETDDIRDVMLKEALEIFI